jgi:hypothetical protein
MRQSGAMSLLGERCLAPGMTCSPSGGAIRRWSQSWRQLPPTEHGGVLQRSSRPQQVAPAGRCAWLLKMWGAEKSLSVRGLPHSGQLGVAVWERTKTSTRALHAVQRYS